MTVVSRYEFAPVDPRVSQSLLVYPPAGGWAGRDAVTLVGVTVAEGLGRFDVPVEVRLLEWRIVKAKLLDDGRMLLTIDAPDGG